MENRTCGNILALALISGLLCVGACAKGISKETLKQVDGGISFRRILENPDAFHGRSVLLGGRIIKTENLKDKTVIIVLQHPLNSESRPMEGDKSEGRFIISAPGFLDPAIYREGRGVTVAGRVEGREVRSLDKIEYSYPVIEKQEIHLWPEEKAPAAEPTVIFGIGLGFGF